MKDWVLELSPSEESLIEEVVYAAYAEHLRTYRIIEEVYPTNKIIEENPGEIKGWRHDFDGSRVFGWMSFSTDEGGVEFAKRKIVRAKTGHICVFPSCWTLMYRLLPKTRLVRGWFVLGGGGAPSKKISN